MKRVVLVSKGLQGNRNQGMMLNREERLTNDWMNFENLNCKCLTPLF